MIKSGGGTLTVNANLNLTTAGSTNSIYLINSTNGDIIVNGNVILNITTQATIATIRQTSGNLTITGNVILPTAYIPSVQTINFTGTLLTINGNIISNIGNGISTNAPVIINGNVGGAYNASAYGISTSANVTVNGSVYSGQGATITSTSAITVDVTGDVYASYNGQPISLTNNSALAIVGGDIYNINGSQAVFAPSLLVSPTSTTKWVLQDGSLSNKTFYSSDTTPNNPITSNVRNGVAYGAGLGTTGTMNVPSPSDVRSGVTIDNTTGSADLSAADILSAIGTSSDPLATRLRTILTDKSAGNLMSQFNNV
jgi:hypothetical protein